MQLKSPNNNGIYKTSVNGKKKEVHELSWRGAHLVNDHGIIISNDLRPKFQGLKYADYAQLAKETREVLYLEPMSAHEDKNYLIRNIVASNEIAELKYDGHRGTLHMGAEANRMFSRTPSKESGWFTENSDQIPHIRDIVLPGFEGTILDGEVDYGTTSMGVQSVMGALPHTAIQYQHKNGFINYFAFDILYYKGVNIQAMPLWKRKVYLMKVIVALMEKYEAVSIHFAMMYVTPKSASSLVQKWSSYTTDFELQLLDSHLNLVDSFVPLFKEMIAAEREGLIVKDINAKYEQKRSKAFIKLKGASTWDVVIMGIKPPTKMYDGKLLAGDDIDTWKYWYHPESDSFMELEDGKKATETMLMQCDPVSKPFFMGWCGAIEFGVWKDGKLVKVGDCKGLTEKVQQELKENWQKYIHEGRVLEVKANGIIDEETGSLRHPRFHAWRDDKNSEDCRWEDHIRKL